MADELTAFFLVETLKHAGRPPVRVLPPPSHPVGRRTRPALYKHWLPVASSRFKSDVRVEGSGRYQHPLVVEEKRDRVNVATLSIHCSTTSRKKREFSGSAIPRQRSDGPSPRRWRL